MDQYSNGFPTVAQLWRGAILGTIAEAIFSTLSTILLHEQTWDGQTYVLQDNEGNNGAVTFDDRGHAVGYLFDHDSERSPWASNAPYDPLPYTAGMPDELRSLGEAKTLRFMFQVVEGTEIPVFTTAFWSRGDRLTAAEPWGAVLTHGADLVRRQVMESDEALSEWGDDCGFDTEQLRALQSLYERRIKSRTAAVVLTHWERQVIASGHAGFAAACELLRTIDITCE